MNIVIDQQVIRKVGGHLDPEVLIQKLENLERRRGEIDQVQIYYRRNECYRPPFNRKGYIRMKVKFQTGEIERYYLGDGRKWRNS